MEESACDVKNVNKRTARPFLFLTPILPYILGNQHKNRNKPKSPLLSFMGAAATWMTSCARLYPRYATFSSVHSMPAPPPSAHYLAHQRPLSNFPAHFSATLSLWLFRNSVSISCSFLLKMNFLDLLLFQIQLQNSSLLYCSWPHWMLFSKTIINISKYFWSKFRLNQLSFYISVCKVYILYIVLSPFSIILCYFLSL